MAGEVKHTPTPWEIEDDEGYADIPGTTIIGPNGYTLVLVIDDVPGILSPKADAAHIVRCVNAHDELVAALTEFCDRVDAGEIRSVNTYAKFKAILTKLSA